MASRAVAKTREETLLGTVAMTSDFRVPFSVGPFKAAARPFLAGATGRKCPGTADPCLDSSAAAIEHPAQVMLQELAEGPYLHIASKLDHTALCQVDVTCRLYRTLNRANAGPWRSLGANAFHAVELERDGLFEPLQDDPSSSSRKYARVDWKSRYARFVAEACSFRSPFHGAEITAIRHPDEVAYCRCRVRADLVESHTKNGLYLELEVLSNPDNLSLAVVDFEAGGRSSVTFSPDTGAVIRERKIREAPRKVEGEYIQPLSTRTPGQHFQGFMGLFLHSGHLAFFRRCKSDACCPEGEKWETTGFITDLAWAQGKRLTPCLAFRDEGKYHVRIAKIGCQPPLVPERISSAYDDASWSSLDWEAGQSDGPEM